MEWTENFGRRGFRLAAPQWDWETRPQCSGTWGTDNCNDASLEEVFHLVTALGYGAAYPAVWGIGQDGGESLLTEALDKARGGRFQRPPRRYPGSAYYTYYDNTCDRSCMAVEYWWMAMAAYLDIFQYRGEDIRQEYR